MSPHSCPTRDELRSHLPICRERHSVSSADSRLATLARQDALALACREPIVACHQLPWSAKQRERRHQQLEARRRMPDPNRIAKLLARGAATHAADGLTAEQVAGGQTAVAEEESEIRAEEVPKYGSNSTGPEAASMLAHTGDGKPWPCALAIRLEPLVMSPDDSPAHTSHLAGGGAFWRCAVQELFCQATGRLTNGRLPSLECQLGACLRHRVRGHAARSRRPGRWLTGTRLRFEAVDPREKPNERWSPRGYLQSPRASPQ